MPLSLLAIGRSEDLAKLIPVPDSKKGSELFSQRNEGLESSLMAENSPDPFLPRWVIHRGLAAAVIPGPAGSFQPLIHATILTAMHRQIDILPVRYGTVVEDDQAVQAFLDARGPALAQALDRLEGASELGLRIELPRLVAPAERVERNIIIDPAHGSTSPAQYLARRRRQFQLQDRVCEQTQQVADDYVQALGGLYRDWRRLTDAPLGVIRLAFLVERDGANVFQDRLAHGPTASTDTRCTLLGPWPPYSFV